MLYQLSYSRYRQNDRSLIPLYKGSWWGGEDSNLRSLRRQIYSLFPLTAREPPQDLPFNRKIGPEKQKIPCGAFLALFFSQLREEKLLPGLIELSGAGEGNRTPNLLITNQLLYRLSYASPGYLPCFFQKSNITFELKRCQGKNAFCHIGRPGRSTGPGRNLDLTFRPGMVYHFHVMIFPGPGRSSANNLA
jgi:hypothetical protein